MRSAWPFQVRDLTKLRIVRVRGVSMVPTLRPGELLLVRIGGAQPRPGQLVIVRWPDTPLAVKRFAHREPDGGWWVERDADVGIDSYSRGAVPCDGLQGIVLGRVWPSPGRVRSAREYLPGSGLAGGE